MKEKWRQFKWPMILCGVAVILIISAVVFLACRPDRSKTVSGPPSATIDRTQNRSPENGKGQIPGSADPDSGQTARPADQTSAPEVTDFPGPDQHETPETSVPTPTSTPIPQKNCVNFSRNGGAFSEPFELTLSAGEGYTIYYTINQADPFKNGTAYTGPIAITEGDNTRYGPLARSAAYYNNPRYSLSGRSPFTATTVCAYAKKGAEVTPVAINTYFVSSTFQTEYSLPYIAITVEEDHFVNEDGIYISVMRNPFETKERIVTFCEFFDENGNKTAGQYAEMAMNGNGSLGNLQKSMRLYFKKDANSGVADNPGKLKYDIFQGRVTDVFGNTITEYKRLLLRNSGNDCTSSFLRDSLMQRLCKELNIDIMESRPALIFINGEFWGMYNVRERYDTKYFKSHYGIAEENFVMLEAPTPLITGNGNSPYELNDGQPGDENAFYELIHFARSSDLSIQQNYQKVADQIDVDNFIDFFICNMYFCNTDWPTNNIKVWRNKNPEDPSGWDTKWRFVLMDMDFGCGLGTDVTYNAMGALTSDTIAGYLMNALLKNTTFRNRFIDRYLYLLENYFTADRMVPVLDKMADEIREPIQLNFARWMASGFHKGAWESGIQTIRNFLNSRTGYVKQHVQEYFGIFPNEVSYRYDSSAVDFTADNAAIPSGATRQYNANHKITCRVAVKNGYELVGITVTDIEGHQTIYNSTSAAFTIDRKTTVAVLTRSKNFSTAPMVEAGSRSAFYLKENGNLYAWGSNEYGQNGIFTSAAVTKPILVMSGVVKIATSHGGNVGDAPHTLILTEKNQLYSIGNNQMGQLGRSAQNQDARLLMPVEIPSGTIADISAGFDHTLVLMKNGDLYGVGNNAYGQIGSANFGGQTGVFQKIASNVAAMAAGRRHSLYIDSAGNLYGLGDNRWKKLIDSPEEKYQTPVRIMGEAAAVYAGEHSTLVVDKNGGLYYFGWRDCISFGAGGGDGAVHNIFNSGSVRRASIQDEHVLFVTENNRVYGWGLNSDGQICSNAGTQSVPYLISANAASAAAGSWFSMILNTDGSITIWGRNTSGIAGNGTISQNASQVILPASLFQ